MGGSSRTLAPRLRLRLRLTGLGWLAASVAQGTRRLNLGASYLSDAVGDLARATVRLLRGDGTRAVFVWHCEPGGYEWRLRRRGARVQVVIGTTADAMARAATETVFQMDCHLRKFADAVLSALRSLLARHGVEGYRKKWYEHSFPILSFAELCRARGRRGPPLPVRLVGAIVLPRRRAREDSDLADACAWMFLGRAMPLWFGGDGSWIVFLDPSARVCSVDLRRRTAAFVSTLPVTALGYSAEADVFASSGADQRVRFFEASSSSAMREVRLPLGRAEILVGEISIVAGRFACATTEGRIVLGELRAGKARRTATVAETIGSVRLDSQGMLRYADAEGCAGAISSRGKRSAFGLELTDEGGPVSATRVGSARIAAAGEGCVAVWDARTKRKSWSRRVDGHPLALAVSPDDAWLACGFADGRVQVRRASSGVRTASELAHEGSIVALGFSPDSKRLATVGSDRVLRLWRL